MKLIGRTGQETPRKKVRVSRWFAALLSLFMIMAVCATVSASASPSNGAATRSSQPITIFLSNPFIGNTWRIQMENQATAEAALPEYHGDVHLVVLNSAANTPTSQTADLLTAIRAHATAIILDASSATALNSTLALACKAGIIVVSFDQVVTAPCAQKLELNYNQSAQDEMDFVAAALGYKGQILVDTGIPGGPASATMTKWWTTVFPKKFPNIHIDGTYMGEFSNGVELEAVSALLAAHREVAGVISEGSCTSDYEAFLRTGLKPLALACINQESNVETCQVNKIPCFFYTSPPWQSALAIQHVWNEVTKGTKYPQLDYIMPLVPATVSSAGARVKVKYINPVAVATVGVNYFPTMPASLVLTVTAPGLGLSAYTELHG